MWLALSKSVTLTWRHIFVCITGLGGARECVCVFLRMCVLCLCTGETLTRNTGCCYACCDVKLLRSPLVNMPLQASKLYLSSKFAETSLIFWKPRLCLIEIRWKQTVTDPAVLSMITICLTFIISAGGRGCGATEEQIASERCLSSSLYKLQKCIYRVILEIKVSYSESQDFVYLKSNKTPEPRKNSFLRKSTFILKWAVATSDWFR